jgi:replicative DNA helicase
MQSTRLKYSNKSILPNNFLAEQAILNILLTNPSLVKDILPELQPNSFYFEPHKIIYETILELAENNNSINLTSVLTKLQDKNCLRKIGGIEKIIAIINRFEDFSNVSDYIEQINEKYLRRLIIELGKQFITWGYTTSEKLENILDKMEHAVYSLSQQNVSQKVYSISEIIDEVFTEMKGKIKKQTTSGLKTTFKDLDSIIQGFQKSDLIIIAGRPSMGKTAFSLNLAKNIVETYHLPLIVFTLEMSRQQIIYRFLSTSSNINTNKLKSGKMSSSEWKTLSEAMRHIAELPIFIDDNPNLTLVEIRSKLRKIFGEKNKTGLIIIDYLQLMKLNFKLENRVQEISYITRNLKLLAKEFEIPIIVLSQLSRNVESRINKRPMLSDLRESGCIGSFSNLKKNDVTSWNKSHLVNNYDFKFQLKGIKPTFQVYLKSFHSLFLTGNHKILSKKGWIKLSQIRFSNDFYSLIKEKVSTKLFTYKYEKVNYIFYQGVKNVYDKTIPFYHNYLISNLVLHNSIEQDADIVILLYREDYYSEKATPNSDVTEFIVAKHRNGPVGTAKLLFNPTTTSFTNLNN